MAGFDYGQMAVTADRLLKRFKQGVVTVTRVTPGTPDEEEPWIPVVTGPTFTRSTRQFPRSPLIRPRLSWWMAPPSWPPTWW